MAPSKAAASGAASSSSVLQPVFSFEDKSDSFEQSNPGVRHAQIDQPDEYLDSADDEDAVTQYSEFNDDDDDYSPAATRFGRAKSGFQDTPKNGNKPGSKRAPGKPIRIEGRISARKTMNIVDLDSDDEIIWKMKNEGYKDEPVRDRLVAEGRTVYDYKTIATRFSRMRKLMAEYEEKTLDDDFSDFHEDEDNHINAAVQEAQPQFELDLIAASEKRWKQVAEILKIKLSKSKYTRNTARARYESLQNGTAALPLEQDPNPAIRKAQRLHERQQRVNSARDKAEREKKKREEYAIRKEREKGERAEAREVRVRELKGRQAREEKQKRERKIEREAKQKVKLEEEETKADRAAMRAVESQVKKKAREDTRAANQWKREQEKAARLQQIQQEKLDKIKAEADAKVAKIVSMQEDTQRRELIRKFMRNAGMETAAPMQAQSQISKQEPEEVVDKARILEAAKNGDATTGKASTIRNKSTAVPRKATVMPKSKSTPSRPVPAPKSKSSSTVRKRKLPISSATVEDQEDEVDDSS